MDSAYSRTAFRVAIGYGVVALGMAIYIQRMTKLKGVGFAFLLFGFPWSLAAVPTNCFALGEGYCLFLVLILNTVTVYSFALAAVRLLGDSK